jgi:hypothetical protein
MKKLAKWQTKLLVFGIIFAFSVLALSINSGKALAFSGSGDGSSAHPFLITNCEQLESIGEDLTSDYSLTQDINCTGTNFHAIGDELDEYQGTLDGQNHSITNLTITQSSDDGVGLFAMLGGTVQNLSIQASISGQGNTGTVAGLILSGAQVSNVSLTSSVSCGSNCGELAGSINGTVQITNVVTHGSLTCDTFCGSLAGYTSGDVTVTDSHSDATVSGSSRLGGLLGKVDSTSGHTTTVTNSYFTGTVTGTGNLIGGISGPSQGLILDKVFSSGTITGASFVGGLVGSMINIGSITLSYSNANVNGVNGVGGLVGTSTGANNTMDNVYYNGDVVATGFNVGGLAGDGTFEHVSFGYAVGSVTGADSVGGLFGFFHDGTIDHLFAANTITLNGGIFKDALVASFAGFSPGDIADHASHIWFDPNTTYDLHSSSFGTSFAMSTGFYYSDSPMFIGWTFDVDHWRTNFNTYPTLKPMLDPYMLCLEPQSTNTTITGGCEVAPLGWGTATWEVRWSVHGKNSWHTVDLDDVRFANEVTVSGLTPGTWYDLQFRWTNDFGIGPWGTVEILTTGTAPSSSDSSSPAPGTKKTGLSLTVDDEEQVPDETTDTTSSPSLEASPAAQLTTVASMIDPKVVINNNFKFYVAGLLFFLLVIGLIKLTHKPKIL